MKNLPKEQQKLVRLLREQGGITYTELAERTESPISTVHGRVKGLEQSGVITRAALLDFAKAGYPFHIKITGKGSGLAKKLAENPASNNVITAMNGEERVFAELIFTNHTNMRETINKLSEYNITIHHVTEVMKREGFVPEK